MTTRFLHKTVLQKESIEGLNIQPGDTYLDGTMGSGGHALAVIQKVEQTPEGRAGKVTVIGLDQDHDALMRANSRIREYLGMKSDVKEGTAHAMNFTHPTHQHGQVTVILRETNYRDLDTVLGELHIHEVNRIMLDLGLSSDQFETSGRGFSFKENEPLLMTFRKNVHGHLQGDAREAGEHILTAKEIVNEWDEENIADIIYGYGEERYARRIAKKIVEARAEKEILSTNDLVEIVKKATPFTYHRGRIHPATRTFQALRIAVNDELNALKDGLAKGFARLAPGGRMAVISFHSLEDRIVKHFYKEMADEVTDAEGRSDGVVKAKIITKKPIEAGDEELKGNPRARSAKLRIIEKL
jgi:16S rRNA (cytosine1402-N4)-methyltransferase